MTFSSIGELAGKWSEANAILNLLAYWFAYNVAIYQTEKLKKNLSVWRPNEKLSITSERIKKSSKEHSIALFSIQLLQGHEKSQMQRMKRFETRLRRSVKEFPDP